MLKIVSREPVRLPHKGLPQPLSFHEREGLRHEILARLDRAGVFEKLAQASPGNVAGVREARKHFASLLGAVKHPGTLESLHFLVSHAEPRKVSPELVKKVRKTRQISLGSTHPLPRDVRKERREKIRELFELLHAFGFEWKGALDYRERKERLL